MAQNLFLENDSPVDFLYLDKIRIASLSGQLSQKGQLTGLKSVASKTTNKGGQIGAALGFGKAEGSRSTNILDSSEETYDPFWSNAYSFLKLLEAEYTVPLDKARIRSLVKFEAFIQLVDLKVMREIWEPAARASRQQSTSPSGIAGNRKERRAQVQPSSTEDLGLGILKGLPHLLHMTFLTVPGEVSLKFWAAIRPEYLSLSSEDLLMKYGPAIDGKWTVVGIVDGYSRTESSPTFNVSPLLDGVVSAMTSVRELMGRPRDHLGITPVAIYGPVVGIAEIEAEESVVQQQSAMEGGSFDQSPTLDPDSPNGEIQSAT